MKFGFKAAAISFTLVILSSTLAGSADHLALNTNSCDGSTEKRRCLDYLEQLRAEWPKALKGDYLATRSISFCYMSGCKGAITPDIVSACGWMLVTLATPLKDATDRRAYRENCEGLSPEQRQAGVAFGEGLSHKIFGKPLAPLPSL
jgi:hypothetical protein